jgi:preprotein translocase subunit YajC
MLISPAYAQAAGAAAGPGMIESLLPLLLIFVVFYFLLIRPQQKKIKQHKEMLGTIRRGDRIVTGGGIFGVVTKVISDNELQVEIADGVKVRVDRAMVSGLVAKTEPADKADKSDDGDAGDVKADDSGEGKESKGAVSSLKKLLGG